MPQSPAPLEVTHASGVNTLRFNRPGALNTIDVPMAQALMRDRQVLSDAIDGYQGLARELADQTELIELGEAEGDAEVVAEAVDAL